MQLLDNGRGRAGKVAGKGGDDGEGEALSVILADLYGRAGLGLTDLDAAELTEVVPGYAIGRQSTRPWRLPVASARGCVPGNRV